MTILESVSRLPRRTMWLSWLRLSLLLLISVTRTPVRSCCSCQPKLSASKFPEPPVRPTPAPPDLWFTAPPTGTTWSQQVKGYNESFPKDFFVYWELLEKVWMLVKVGKVLIWLGQWKQSRRQFAAKSGTSGSWTVQRLGLGLEMQLLGEMLLQKEEETNMEPQPRH